MIGRTLGVYVGRRLALSIVFALAATLLLVFVLDFVELIRRAGDRGNVSLTALGVLAAIRTPSVAEAVLPFAILFAGMAAFLQLSRKSELVVARATGVSVWQLLVPALVVAFLVGALATMALNPLSAMLREVAAEREAELLSGNATATTNTTVFLRQRSVDGQSILRAASSSDRGRSLGGVTAFVFTPGGAFQERVDAATASFRAGFWELSDVRVLRPGTEPESHPTYILATNLSADQVAETLTPIQAISFWELPSVIALSEQAGLSVQRFELQFQSLLARPALLGVMVLIAATVSLRLFRLGGLSRVLLGGIFAGFMLYVVTKLAEDLGAAGFVAPAVAAWMPAAIGALMSVTVLLYQEDG